MRFIPSNEGRLGLAPEVDLAILRLLPGYASNSLSLPELRTSELAFGIGKGGGREADVETERFEVPLLRD